MEPGEWLMQFGLVERNIHRDIQCDGEGLLNRHDQFQMDREDCSCWKDDVCRGIIDGEAAGIDRDPCAVDIGWLG